MIDPKVASPAVLVVANHKCNCLLVLTSATIVTTEGLTDEEEVLL